MEKDIKNQEYLELQEGLPLNEEQTEEIIEEIQELLDSDEQPAALEIFSQLRPGDQSEVIEELPLETQQEILTSIPPDEAAEIIEHLEPEEVVKVAEGVDTAVLSDILDAADSDVQADIIRLLPDEIAEDVLEEMEEAALVTQLLQYNDDSAGGRMVLEYVVVRENATTTDALNALRQNEPEVEDIHSIFVVDSQDKLTGELSISRLALSRSNTRIKRIMDADITYVTSDTPQEECVHVMERYSLAHLPVVDEEKRLIGVIRSEDAFKVIEEEATEDMYKLAGIPDERIFGPLLLSVRNRLPWLSLNLVTTFLAALVISVFEATIARVVTLAVFLPVVAGQGGIGGTQTLTLVVRSIALGEITRKSGLRLLGREISLGLLHGMILGIVVGLVAYIWKGEFMLGVILTLAMIGNMFIAGLTGAGIPVLLTRLRIDPALASAVLITTCTDVIGFFLFLGLATMLVNYLI